MIAAVAIVLGIALGIAVLVMVVRSRRSGDGVDSFRRQIDALSPEARRPVVDQVQHAASRIETRPVDAPRDEPSDDAGGAPDAAAATEAADATDADAATDAEEASGTPPAGDAGAVDPIERDDGAGGARGA